MKRILLLVVLMPFFSKAQTIKPVVDLNTVFVCIDSATYQKLFTNKYIKDTLFFCREQSAATGTDAYAGKYFIGMAATMEFFKPTASLKLGDKFADLGIEFKTRAVGDLDWYVKKAAKNNVAVTTETVTIDDEGKKVNWYKELNVKDKAISRFAISLLEYQKEYLSLMGFTDKEIANPMNYAAYNQKLAGGRKYPRKFNTFNQLNITINNNELAYLKKIMKLLQFTNKGAAFYGSDVTISYKVDNKSTFRLNSVGMHLLDKMDGKQVLISDNLTLKVKEYKAELVFKN